MLAPPCLENAFCLLNSLPKFFFNKFHIIVCCPLLSQSKITLLMSSGLSWILVMVFPSRATEDIIKCPHRLSSSPILMVLCSFKSLKCQLDQIFNIITIILLIITKLHQQFLAVVSGSCYIKHANSFEMDTPDCNKFWVFLSRAFQQLVFADSNWEKQQKQEFLTEGTQDLSMGSLCACLCNYTDMQNCFSLLWKSSAVVKM